MTPSTPSRKVEACLLDLYDTLVYVDSDRYRRKTEVMAEIAGVTPTAFIAAWNSHVVTSNLGKFPHTRDRAAATLESLGVRRPAAAIDAIALEEHCTLREGTRLFADSVSTLSLLRSRGMKLAIVTNASPTVWDVVTAHGLRGMVDAIVVSSAIGVRKPDPPIYGEALAQLVVGATRAAFVGDGNDLELDGAKRLGMLTILIARGSFRPVCRDQSSHESIDFAVSSLSEVPRLLGVS